MLSRGKDNHTSDLSCELSNSKKQITNQALNMELDLKKKKQDILSLRDDYYMEKEQIDDGIRSLLKKIECKEQLIHNEAFPQINGDIHKLECRIAELKQEKKEHLEDLQIYNDSLDKISNRKFGLKDIYINHIKLEHNRLSEIKCNLAKLKSAEVISNKKNGNVDDIAKYENLSTQIQKFERKLECPVCLEICQHHQPIYQCQESHIICSTCRSRAKKCPQCLVTFEKKKQRHRYAEEDAEELLKLYKDRETVLNNIHERENKMLMRNVYEETVPSKRNKTIIVRTENSLDMAASLEPSRGKADHKSDFSFEISKKEITSQTVNMELGLNKKKQDIISLRDEYDGEIFV